MATWQVYEELRGKILSLKLDGKTVGVSQFIRPSELYSSIEIKDPAELLF